MRCARHPGAATSPARTRGGGGGVARPRCSTRPRRVASGAANAVLVYRAFNERSGRRFGQPIPPSRGRCRRSTGTRRSGSARPAKMYSLWYQRYMYEYGVTNEDFGRYTVVARSTRRPTRTRGSTTGPSPSTTTRRRAGSSSRCCACSTAARRATGASRSSSPAPTAAKDLPQPAVRIEAAAEAHSATASVMYNYYHADLAEFPECGVPRRRSSASGGARARRHRRRDDLRELQPGRVPTARGVRLLRTGRGEGLHRRRQHRPRRQAARQHQRRPARRGLHPRLEQHPRGRAPDARHRGQPGPRRRAHPGRPPAAAASSSGRAELSQLCAAITRSTPRPRACCSS